MLQSMRFQNKLCEAKRQLNQHTIKVHESMTKFNDIACLSICVFVFQFNNVVIYIWNMHSIKEQNFERHLNEIQVHLFRMLVSWRLTYRSYDNTTNCNLISVWKTCSFWIIYYIWFIFLLFFRAIDIFSTKYGIQCT